MEQLNIFSEDLQLEDKAFELKKKGSGLAVKEVESTKLTISQEEPLFETGERVKVTARLDEKSMDPEDYFYLKDFSNKKGIVSSVSKNSEGKYSYEVDFDKGVIGLFYEEDLIEI